MDSSNQLILDSYETSRNFQLRKKITILIQKNSPKMSLEDSIYWGRIISNVFLYDVKYKPDLEVEIEKINKVLNEKLLA